MSDKINIHWFPGHMTKAKRQMEANLKMVDVVIELRDARIPISSANPMLQQLANNKPKLIVLTKKDLVQNSDLIFWQQKLQEENTKVISVNVLKDNLISKIKPAILELMELKIQRQIRKGIKPRAIRCMIVGIPNVGKSTFINQIAKKAVAKTANKPGVTKALQWVKIDKEIELLDTPGVLWPKIEDPQVAKKLAIIGSMNDLVIPLETLAYDVLKILCEQYKNELQSFYEIEISQNVEEVWESIGIKRGYLLNNHQIDKSRFVQQFFKDIRSGKIAKITWENVYGD